MKVQRVRASEPIEADQGKVALRYGPIVYSIEKVDQDITKPLASDAPLKAEWRPDLLGGVMAVTGQFADGAPLLAIPNFARMNREPAATPATTPPAQGNPPGTRPAPQPPVSVVWITEKRA
jgi:DUF1680 family protein